MAIFAGTPGVDIADATIDILMAFATGSLAELKDAVGNEFLPDADDCPSSGPLGQSI